MLRRRPYKYVQTVGYELVNIGTFSRGISPNSPPIEKVTKVEDIRLSGADLQKAANKKQQEN